MNRRALITLLGGAAWPLAARGQRGERTRRIRIAMPLLRQRIPLPVQILNRFRFGPLSDSTPRSPAGVPISQFA
jgi:hypothetical protein